MYDNRYRFFENRHGHAISFFSPHNRHITSNTTMTAHHTTKATRHNTTQHNTTPHITSHHTTPHHITLGCSVTRVKHIILSSTDTAHFIRSGTRLAQDYQDNCVLHGAHMFAEQGMGQGPCTLALRASQSRVCVQRDPTGRVLILLVIENRKRADKRKKEKERREERARER